MDKLKYIKIENEDGSLSDNIPLGVDAENVDTNDGSTVEIELNNLKNKDSSQDNSINNLNNKINIQNNSINNLKNQINSLASGSPLVASSVSEMTDTKKVYVNTTDGHWYYYNGTNWIAGGVYQAETISNNSIDFSKINNEFFNNVQNSLKINTFKDGNYYFPLNWELGNIDIKTGQNSPVLQNPTTLRTTNFLNANNFKTLILNIFNNFNVVILTYDKDYNFIKVLNNFNTAGNVIPYNTNTNIEVDSFYYFKLIMSNENYSSSITLSDSINVNVISNYNYNYNNIINISNSFSNVKGVDLTWYLGGLDINTGEETNSATLIRTDFINCKLVERIKIDNYASSFMILYYDINKKYITHTEQFLGKQSYIINKNENVEFLRIILGDTEHEQSIENGNLLYCKFINNNFWKNKRLSILGDSISTYEGITPSDKASAFFPKGNLQDVNNTYWKLVQNALGMNLETNNSYSSSTVTTPNMQYTSFCDENRLNSLGNPDLVIIEGGTNDIYTGKDSSNIDSFDILNYDTTKFTDAYAYVIRNIQNKYPWAKIICITPCFIVNNETYNRPNCTYQRINDICDNIITLCKHLGATPIDLRTSGINMGNILNTTVDGLHWNMIGHNLVANLILEKLLN